MLGCLLAAMYAVESSLVLAPHSTAHGTAVPSAIPTYNCLQVQPDPQYEYGIHAPRLFDAEQQAVCHNLSQVLMIKPTSKAEVQQYLSICAINQLGQLVRVPNPLPMTGCIVASRNELRCILGCSRPTLSPVSLFPPGLQEKTPGRIELQLLHTPGAHSSQTCGHSRPAQQHLAALSAAMPVWLPCHGRWHGAAEQTCLAGHCLCR